MEWGLREGGKERKEKLYPGDERERERQQRMHVIQLRNATRMMTDEIKSGRGRERA